MNKILIISLIISLGACQSKQTKESISNEQHNDSSEIHTIHKDAINETKTGTKQEGALENLITEYLNLNNALTADLPIEAAVFGERIVSEISRMDVKSFTSDQKEVFDEVMEDAKEQAEHIGENANNIAHQREHFALLSKDLNDLIVVFGTKRKLYQAFCPMYDDKKGTIWLSENKEIKNPYYGSKMLSCGSIQKDL